MNKITSLIVASLITVMGVTAKAADFIIELVPGPGSVGTPEVSSIDVSKIANLRLKLPGEVFTFAGSVCPSSISVLADGASLAKVGQYAALYAAIGDAHGASGANFNVPDYRGRFLRGVDGGTNRDPNNATRTAMNTGGAVGSSVGSVQGFATARPTSSFVTGVESAGHTHGISAVTTSTWGAAGGSINVANSTFTSSSMSSGGASNSHTHTVTSGGDSETRPVNASVLFCIAF